MLISSNEVVSTFYSKGEFAMIIGVGFLLFAPINGADKLFVLRELKSKPELHKRSGMLSFPLETFESRDGCPKATIYRLIEEEMGISQGKAQILGFSTQSFCLIPGRPDVLTFYGFGRFIGDPNQSFHPADDDIEFVDWMKPEDLLGQFVRVEVAPILGHFLNNFSSMLNEQK